MSTPELPAGTVRSPFTGIEGSTRLLLAQPLADTLMG